MINKIREIPVSEHSYTFEAATKNPQFREKGYEEKSISSMGRRMSITGKMGKLQSNMQMFRM